MRAFGKLALRGYSGQHIGTTVLYIFNQRTGCTSDMQSNSQTIFLKNN